MLVKPFRRRSAHRHVGHGHRTADLPAGTNPGHRVWPAALLAIGIMTVATIGVGALAIDKVSAANTELTRMNSRNVERLGLLGEMRSRQVRVNHGVVMLAGSSRMPEMVPTGRQLVSRAAADMDRLMWRYERQVRGTPAQQGFARLMREWRYTYHGMRVHLLGAARTPGQPLPGPGTMGDQMMAITDSIDQQARLEQKAAEKAEERQRAAYHDTIMHIIGGLATGLTLAGAVVILAVRVSADRRRAEQRLHALMYSTSDVITVVDEKGYIGYVSPSVEAQMGYRPSSVLGMRNRDFIHPEDLPRLEETSLGVLSSRDLEHRLELRVRHADGHWRWHELVIRNLLHDPAVRGVVANHRDISERRKFQDQLTYDATHDALTGAANRAAFLYEVDRALDRAGRENGHAAVLYLDLDDFKRVNDAWGHEVGDALLAAVAALLKRSVLGSDTVARLGGDEFGVLLTRIDSLENAEAVARRITTGLSEPVNAAGHSICAAASVGVALSGPGAWSATELLRHADLAMYEVKRQDHLRWRSYDEDLAAGAATAAMGRSALRYGRDPDAQAGYEVTHNRTFESGSLHGP